MRRRDFLQVTSAASLLAATPLKAAFVTPATTAAGVVISGISPKTNPRDLEAAIEAFELNGVWLTCVIDLPSDDHPAEDYLDLVRSLETFGSNVEIAANVPDLAELTPYFQARRTFEAKRLLTSLFSNSRQVQTVACEPREKFTQPLGVRSASVRNVLVLPADDGSTQTEKWPNGVVRAYGGFRLENGKSVPQVEAAPGKENRTLYYLSAEDIAGASQNTAGTDWLSAIAEELSLRELNGDISLMTVSDMQLRDDFKYQRFFAVIVDQGEGSAQFQRELKIAGIPSTILPMRPATEETGDHFWVPRTLPSPGATSVAMEPVSVNCTSGQAFSLKSENSLPPGSLVKLADLATGGFGIDECGALSVPAMSLEEIDLSALGIAQDGFIRVPSDQLASRGAREQVLKQLLQLKKQATSRFVTIKELTRAIQIAGPIESRHRNTLVEKSGFIAAPPVSVENEREQLLEDAQTAWEYFRRHTNRSTGLIPASMNTVPGGDVHQAVTMWDVGSHIMALSSARKIGLISEKELKRAMSRILPNIAGRRSQGRLLPQGWIRTDRRKWGNKNFDGCDAGRLLACLDAFRRNHGMEDELRKLVESWDLNDIIIDGEIHSVTDGKLHTTYRSHCAHYSALAFRNWGFDVKSPYETFADQSRVDGEMALLEAVAWIGPLGAEPLLLEAMELGMSDESAYLADVLFNAQVEEFRETGKLVCVSETPVDRAPWFIYQGLQLDSQKRRWALDTVGDSVEFLTEDAAEEFLAVSAKAAFLWASYMPSGYSNKLIDLVRAKAPSAHGFSSSINIKTGRVTENYTDINTNAIILQAVANRLEQL